MTVRRYRRQIGYLCRSCCQSSSSSEGRWSISRTLFGSIFDPDQIFPIFQYFWQTDRCTAQELCTSMQWMYSISLLEYMSADKWQDCRAEKSYIEASCAHVWIFFKHFCSSFKNKMFLRPSFLQNTSAHTTDTNARNSKSTIHQIFWAVTVQRVDGHHHPHVSEGAVLKLRIVGRMKPGRSNKQSVTAPTCQSMHSQPLGPELIIWHL